MPATSLAYRSLLRLGSASAPLLGIGNRKLRASHEGRREAVQRLAAWGLRTDPARPVVWFHAPSVGEGIQAESILTILRARHPEWQFLYTHFSPSAESFARRLDVDYADYLPYDRSASVRAVLETVRPTSLVFVKLDLWPELATRAARLGTTVLLAAATVRPDSGRLRWPVRRWLAPGYGAVASAGAITTEDAARLAQLGVPADRVEVTGDPRCDAVLAVVARGVPADADRILVGGARPLVAGSTWPRDEAVVLEAFVRVRHRAPDARLLIAPHEPTAQHLAGLASRAASLGVEAPVPLSRATGDEPLIVVDQVGLLARLYGVGLGALVGGGFGRSGLHSVLEPAGWGLPVAFGPRWTTNRDAKLLLGGGGGTALEGSDAATTLASTWLLWMDPAARRDPGQNARAVVEAGAGAAERNAELVDRATAAGRRPPLGT